MFYKNFRLLIIMLLVVITTPISAHAFTDTFDDIAYTNANWIIGFGEWDHVTITGTDLAYHGIRGTDFTAAIIANNGSFYNQKNLHIESYLMIEDYIGDEDSIGFAFVNGEPITSNDYMDLTMGIEYEKRELNVWNRNGNNVTKLGGVVINDLALNVWYKLVVETDIFGNVDVQLYQADSLKLLGSFEDLNLQYPFDYGMVAISPTVEGSFNNFILEGSELHLGDITLTIPTNATEGDGVLTGQGSVTVTAAPDADLTINLSSDDTSEITIPATVVIAANSTSATFDITVVDDSDVDNSQTANISARANNYSNGSASIQIDDNDNEQTPTNSGGDGGGGSGGGCFIESLTQQEIFR